MFRVLSEASHDSNADNISYISSSSYSDDDSLASCSNYISNGLSNSLSDHSISSNVSNIILEVCKSSFIALGELAAHHDGSNDTLPSHSSTSGDDHVHNPTVGLILLSIFGILTFGAIIRYVT